MVELGRILDEQQMHDQALDFLLAAHRVEPSSVEVNNNLGNVYLNKEMFDDSITHYRRAIQQRPNDTLMRYNLALAYIGSRRFSEAQSALNEVIKIDASYWPAYQKLGEVLIAKEEQDDARRILRQLLDRNPQYTARAEVEALLAGL